MHCIVIVLKRQLHEEIPQGEFCYLSDELLAKHVYISIQDCQRRIWKKHQPENNLRNSV